MRSAWFRLPAFAPPWSDRRTYRAPHRAAMAAISGRSPSSSTATRTRAAASLIAAATVGSTTSTGSLYVGISTSTTGRGRAGPPEPDRLDDIEDLGHDQRDVEDRVSHPLGAQQPAQVPHRRDDA